MWCSRKISWCHPAWVQILALLLTGCTSLCPSLPICKVGVIVRATSRVCEGYGSSGWPVVKAQECLILHLCASHHQADPCTGWSRQGQPPVIIQGPTLRKPPPKSLQTLSRAMALHHWHSRFPPLGQGQGSVFSCLSPDRTRLHRAETVWPQPGPGAALMGKILGKDRATEPRWGQSLAESGSGIEEVQPELKPAQVVSLCICGRELVSISPIFTSHSFNKRLSRNCSCGQACAIC